MAEQETRGPGSAGTSEQRTESKDQTTKRPKESADAPGGAAVFDPAQQTVRQDIDEDDSGAAGESMRGSLPPQTGAPRQASQSPAVPGSPADRGETRGASRPNK